MSAGIHLRKRDRLRGLFGKPAPQPSTNSAEGNRFPPSFSAPLRVRSLQLDDISQSFFADTLKELTPKEQLVIREHVAPHVGNISDIVQVACDAAHKQKTICEDKRWPGSDKAHKVLQWLERFKFVGDVVANVDPVHVGMPWSAVRMLLEVAVADIRQMNSLLSGMDLALAVANRLRAYFVYFQRLPPALTTDNFYKALVSLYAHTLRFFAAAIWTYSSNPAARKLEALWRTPELVAFADQSDKLERRADIEANICDRELHAKGWEGSSQLKVDLSFALQELDRIRGIQELLGALHVKVDLSKLVRVEEAIYNSSAEGKLSICLDGTRFEILHKIAQWAEKSDGELIFWLCGKAGTGKSTISRTVAHNFDKQQRLGASFFFKRGQNNRSNADYFFPTIAALLADRIPQMQEPIAAALDKDSFLCGKGLQEQFDKLLMQPLLNVDPAQLPTDGIAIVIDALDECDQNTDIRMFLKLLAQVEAKSALRLRIFITSRPALPIELGFRQLNGKLHQDIVLEEVQEQTIRRDIRAYFDNEFLKIKQDRLLKRPYDALPADWPTKEDLQVLVDLAVPLFIFASTVCRFVSESNPQKRLKSILEQRYRAGSSHLAKTYQPILDQLMLEKEEKQNDTLIKFREAVGPIILAADPLSVTSLASLLCLDQEDISDRLEGLHSVLNIPSDLFTPVTLLHLSFREFLVDSERTDKDGFWIDEAETHRQLAHYCLRRLSEPGTLKSDICYVDRPGFRRIGLKLEQVTSRIPHDVVYACCYWPVHLVKSGERLSDGSEAYQFLRHHFLHWLEALSWLGRLSSTVAHISKLLLIAKGENSSDAAAFLNDAKRFILKNRYVIDNTPLQIYHSALIFAPSQSTVRKIFLSRHARVWSLLPTMPMGWSAEVLKFEGHNDSVTAVAFSPDGQFIASASRDQTVRLWNTQTSETIQELEGHKEGVTAVAFSPNGQSVVSASWDQTVRLWSTQTGETIHKFEGHDDSVTAVAFSPDGQFIVSASRDQTGRVWNAQTGKMIQKLEGHNDSVTAVTFSPDGQFVASASRDQTVRLWNAQTGKTIQQLKGHDDGVIAIAFSPDGQSVVSASWDQTVRLWNTQTGETTHELEEYDDGITAVGFSLDGQCVASASWGHIVRLWSTQTGETTQKLDKPNSHVTAVAFSQDKQSVALALRDRTVRLWNAQTAQISDTTQKLEEHGNRVTAVAFSPDGQFLASASWDQTVRLWNVETNENIQIFPSVGNIYQIKFSSDGKALETDVGRFVLEHALTNLGENTDPRTPDLELSKQWVRHQNADLLWLPYEYRGYCSASHGKSLAIGQASGALTIFRLM